MPDVCAGALVCLACHNWQIDITHHARSDLGGARDALMVAAEAHAEHLSECPGAGGRVKGLGQWVDRPEMSGGKQADGLLGMIAFPRWWVAK